MGPPTIPDRIGRYRIVRHAGSGAFASVFEAVDERLDSTVAVKLLADNWRYNPDVHRRFRDEAVLARRLTSDNGSRSLVQVFDIDQTEGGQPYFVMEWASGGILAERKRPQGWSVDEVRPVVRALAQAMSDLHGADVIHRDIKPSNILVLGPSDQSESLLGPTERLVLGDLGLAKDLTDDQSQLSLVAGTNRFTAPEALEPGYAPHPSMDIFAATRVVSDLVVGHPCAAGLAQFVADGTALDPATRPGSAAGWLRSFEHAASAPPTIDRQKPIEATASPMEANDHRSRRRVVTRLVGAIVMVTAVVSAIVLLASGSSIKGPGQIMSGEAGSYRLDGVDVDLPWVDPAGRIVLAPTLEVIGRLPGEISISVAHDGDRHHRTITVIASPDGPTIVGPKRVVTGENAEWAVEDVDGQNITWSTTAGDSQRGPVMSLTPSVDMIVQVVSTDDTGIARGAQLEVEVDR